MAMTIAVIIAMIAGFVLIFFPSMFSPWPRWRETDGGDGRQPQEGRSLLSRPPQERGHQRQQGGRGCGESFFVFFLRNVCLDQILMSRHNLNAHTHTPTPV